MSRAELLVISLVCSLLFAEIDSHNFEAIDHRGYKQVLRQTRALQNRLFDGTKFETMIRYRCANLFFLVLPQKLFRESEIPIGWGALIESNGAIELARKPTWHAVSDQNQLRLLERIAPARGGPAAGVIGAALLASQEYARATRDTQTATASEGVL